MPGALRPRHVDNDDRRNRFLSHSLKLALCKLVQAVVVNANFAWSVSASGQVLDRYLGTLTLFFVNITAMVAITPVALPWNWKSKTERPLLFLLLVELFALFSQVISVLNLLMWYDAPQCVPVREPYPCEGYEWLLSERTATEKIYKLGCLRWRCQDAAPTHSSAATLLALSAFLVVSYHCTIFFTFILLEIIQQERDAASQANDHVGDDNAIDSDDSGRFPVDQYRRERALALSQNNGDISTSDDSSPFDGDDEETMVGSSPEEESESGSDEGPFFSGDESASGRSASGSSALSIEELVMTPTGFEDDEYWYDIGENSPLL